MGHSEPTTPEPAPDIKSGSSRDLFLFLYAAKEVVRRHGCHKPADAGAVGLGYARKPTVRQMRCVRAGLCNRKVAGSNPRQDAAVGTSSKAPPASVVRGRGSGKIGPGKFLKYSPDHLEKYAFETKKAFIIKIKKQYKRWPSRYTNKKYGYISESQPKRRPLNFL